MKEEVQKAIEDGIESRRKLLRQLPIEHRAQLLEQLFVDFFGNQHLTLQKWAALTGQSAQVDTGYIAQFVASLVLGEPGQGFRGKGDDLADGSEVKGAANISGVDRPRWNHNLGTPADDRARLEADKPMRIDEYLASPHLFYLLVDRVVGVAMPAPIRIRGWCLDARKDEDWRNLFKKYSCQKTSKQYNLQLHPPVGYDDNIVVNTLGNLDLTDVLVFDARLALSGNDGPEVKWHVPLRKPILPIRGRTVAKPYGGRADRPSRLTGAADIVADIATVPRLFPGIFNAEQEAQLETATKRELDA